MPKILSLLTVTIVSISQVGFASEVQSFVCSNSVNQIQIQIQPETLRVQLSLNSDDFLPAAVYRGQEMVRLTAVNLSDLSVFNVAFDLSKVPEGNLENVGVTVSRLELENGPGSPIVSEELACDLNPEIENLILSLKPSSSWL